MKTNEMIKMQGEKVTRLKEEIKKNKYDLDVAEGVLRALSEFETEDVEPIEDYKVNVNGKITKVAKVFDIMRSYCNEEMRIETITGRVNSKYNLRYDIKKNTSTVDAFSKSRIN